MATRLTMDAAADYRIRVQGKLADSWLQWHGPDLTVEIDADAPDRPVTTLTAQLLDQAALMGLLSSLYESNVPLLSVESIEPAGDG